MSAANAHAHVFVYLHNVPRADSVHLLSMPRADFQPRADTLDVYCWFWHQIWTRHPWKPRNWPYNYEGSLSLPLELKVFLEAFYTWMKVRSWLKPHTFQSAFHMLSADHWNIDGPPFPVKLRKFRSALGGEVAYRCVRVCVLTQCANSWHCAYSTHAKCGLSTKSEHNRGPLLVLASDLDSSSLKT